MPQAQISRVFKATGTQHHSARGDIAVLGAEGSGGLLSNPLIDFRPREAPGTSNLECWDLLLGCQTINGPLGNLEVSRNFLDGEDFAFAFSVGHSLGQNTSIRDKIVQNFQDDKSFWCSPDVLGKLESIRAHAGFEPESAGFVATRKRYGSAVVDARALAKGRPHLLANTFDDSSNFVQKGVPIWRGRHVRNGGGTVIDPLADD